MNHGNSSSGFMGVITSLGFLGASFVPEVPPLVQWICLILSAAASITAIIKNRK
jgi:hypothetical protein